MGKLGMFPPNKETNEARGVMTWDISTTPPALIKSLIRKKMTN